MPPEAAKPAYLEIEWSTGEGVFLAGTSATGWALVVVRNVVRVSAFDVLAAGLVCLGFSF